MKAIANNKNEIKLNIIGDGKQKELLIELANTLNIQLEVQNKLIHSELIKSYNNYKFFITSSNFEGSPKTLLEAMCSGCVVIASNIESHQELISHGINGFLFDFNNDNFNIFMKDVNTNYDLEKISSNAIKKIEEEHSFKVVIDKYLKDFIELIEA